MIYTQLDLNFDCKRHRVRTWQGNLYSDLKRLHDSKRIETKRNLWNHFLAICVLRERKVVFQSSLKLFLTGNFRSDIQVKR